MRKIKFRGWGHPDRYDMEPKRMLHWEDDVKPMPMAALSRKDFIFMQFVGLTDKNGVEIYEGDIVEYRQNALKTTKPGLGSVNFEGGSFGIEVAHDGEWTYEYADGTKEPMPLQFYGPEGQEFSWDDLEVIGNIHQHPELLTNSPEVS